MAQAAQQGATQFTASKIASDQSSSPIVGGRSFPGVKELRSSSPEEPPMSTWLPWVAILVPLLLWEPNSLGLSFPFGNKIDWIQQLKKTQTDIA